MDGQISNQSHEANIARALETISAYCDMHNINYAITGTVALDLLGAHIQVKPPQDIDLLVEHTPTNFSYFKQLEILAGLQKEAYKDMQEMRTQCFTFIVCGVKVNVLMNYKMTDTIQKETVQIKYFERSIKVHKVRHAMLAKMKLGRPKDYKYFNAFIHWITEML